MVNPLVTVVIAVYNREKTLQQCLDSVFCQTFKNYELIVIDGASTDSTVEIIKKNESKITKWVSESDRGIYDAWNKGLAHATGEWVCFLGSDDYLHSNTVLEEFAAQLNELSPQIEFVFAKVMLVSEAGSEIYVQEASWPSAFKQIKRGMVVPHPGMMHRMSTFNNSGYFDPSFRIAGDYEFFIRNARIDNVRGLDLIAVDMRQGGISSDFKNHLVSLRECRRAISSNGLGAPSIYWFLDYAFVLFRAALFKLFGVQRTHVIVDRLRKFAGRKPYWTQLSD